jgi:hypothetical protein
MLKNTDAVRYFIVRIARTALIAACLKQLGRFFLASNDGLILWMGKYRTAEK